VKLKSQLISLLGDRFK